MSTGPPATQRALSPSRLATWATGVPGPKNRGRGNCDGCSRSLNDSVPGRNLKAVFLSGARGLQKRATGKRLRNVGNLERGDDSGRERKVASPRFGWHFVQASREKLINHAAWPPRSGFRALRPLLRPPVSDCGAAPERPRPNCRRPPPTPQLPAPGTQLPPPPPIRILCGWCLISHCAAQPQLIAAWEPSAVVPPLPRVCRRHACRRWQLSELAT